MKRKTFNIIVNSRLSMCKKVLAVKATDYANEEDRLHNFKLGAVLVRQTPKQYALELVTKHFVAIADKITNDEVMEPKFVTEKIGDIINYMLLIEALNKERQ